MKIERAPRRFDCLWMHLLLMVGFVGVLNAQEPTQLTGTVTDAAGNPIPSANIQIEDMQLGATTNQQGRFLLVVPASRVRGQEVTVRADLIGRSSQTETVTLSPGESVVLDFVLAEDPLRLDEIIVTGAGTTQLREQLGVSINTVRAEQIERSQEPNLVAAMAGTAPNMEVTSSSGDPGSGAYIRIRGANSLLGDGQPLFVVDGVPIFNTSGETDEDFDDVAGTTETNRAFDLNPRDIADIQILKGPSAAAIYGSRAADGVVLVTTRQGQAGSNNISYRIEYAMDDVTQMPGLQQGFGQGLAGAPGLNDAFGLPAGTISEDPGTDVCASVYGLPTDRCPVSWGLPVGSNPTYDHSSDIFETGHRLEQFLTFNGGSETTRYYLSLGNMQHDGVITGPQSYQRTTVRMSGSHAFRDDLRLGANFQFSDSEGDLVQQGSNISGILLGALRTPPDFNNDPYVVDVAGLPMHRSYRLQNPTSLEQARGYDNPLWIANEIRNTTEVGRTFGNVQVDYTPFNWLSLNYTLGADYSADERASIFPKSSSDFPDGRMVRTDLVRFQLDHNLVATATRDLSDDLRGTLALGQNLNHREYRRYQVNGTNLIYGTDQLDYTVNRVPNEYRETVRTDGYFAQGTIDAYDELFLTAALRMDGSSTFGTDDNRFFYPKFSGSWIFTDRVADRIDALSFAKLRFAFGIAGKQPEPFSNVSGYETGTITDGWLTPNGLQTIYAGYEGVVREDIRGNENIDPERITEWEVGGDAAFFDDRLSLGLTYYSQNTSDAIIDVDVAPSTGFDARYLNAAEFTNWGWEATLEALVYQSDDVRWDLGLQWGTNDSCVESLAGAEVYGLEGFVGSINGVVAPERDEDGNITRCYPINTFYGSDFIRFGRGSVVSGVDIDATYDDWSPGDLYIADDGFPRQDGQTRVLGDANPDWTGSVRSSLTFFDNLEVSGLLDIKSGGNNWNGTRGALYFFGTHADTEPYHGAGQEEVFGETYYPHEGVAGPGAGQPVNLNWVTWFWNGIGSGFTGPSIQDIEDSGFVKLRHVTLRYTLQEMDWMDSMGFSSMTLGVSGRNLQTWTDYSGIDPEANLTGQTLGRGIDYFNNPQTRSYVFSVTLNR